MTQEKLPHRKELCLQSEILDNPNIDFSKTDYFIIEYGINDYFEGAPRSYDDQPYSAYTYAGHYGTQYQN